MPMTMLADIFRRRHNEPQDLRALVGETAEPVSQHRVAERAAVTTRFAFEIAANPQANFSDRIDRNACVIKGVKIIGLESKNTGRVIGLDQREFGAAVDRPYAYTPDALKAAIPLYEGAHVFSNHTKFDFDERGARRIQSSERQNEDMLGWLSNVHYVESQGLYGDLNYLNTHPMSQRLVEVASKNPRLMALSHEAVFDAPQVSGGRIYLTKISGVDSVALVSSKPGTTNGLFESFSQLITEEPQMSWTTTLREILESTPVGTKGRGVLLEMITEAGPAPNHTADAPVQLPPAPGGQDLGPQEKIRQGMLAAVNAKLEDADVDALRSVLQALNLSDSIAECSSRRPPNVQEEAPPAGAAPDAGAGPPPPAAPPAAPPMDAGAGAPPPAGGDAGAPPPQEPPPAQESTPPSPELAPAPSPSGPAITPDAADGPAPPFGGDAPADKPPFLDKGKLAQESAVVDRSGLVMECAEILATRGVPASGVILKAMLNLDTPEERQSYAATIAESRAPGIPESMRIPRSSSPPAPAAKPDNRVAESELSDPAKFAKHLRQRHVS